MATRAAVITAVPATIAAETTVEIIRAPTCAVDHPIMRVLLTLIS